MNETLHTISVMALPIIIAIVFHEVAHGFVAWRLGDDTAHRLGRITLNPHFPDELVNRCPEMEIML